MSFYNDVFAKNQYQLADAATRSVHWFRRQQTLLVKQNITAARLINTQRSKNTPSVLPGYMYLFQYDPKYKDTLPYWDKYPLVLPFNKYKNGFIGLNLHYAPYMYRIQLIDELLNINQQNINDVRKLKMSWGLISASAQSSVAQVCIHRYLFSHVQTPFKKIDTADWTTAALLPVQKFVGASTSTVFRKSLKRI